MEHWLSALWMGMEFLALLFLGDAFLNRRGGLRHRVFAFLIWMALTYTYTNRGLPQPLKLILSLGLILCILGYLYRGTLPRKVLVAVMSFTCMAVLDTAFLYGAAALLKISLEQLVWKKWYYIIVVTAGKLFAVLLAWALRRFRPVQSGQQIPGQFLALALLFPVVSLMMLAVVFAAFRGNEDLSTSALVFSVILCIANVALMYLISIVEIAMREKQENTLLHQQMEIQMEGITALEKAYRAQREASHEFQHHLQTIHDLLSNAQSSEAKDYVKKLQAVQTIRVLAVNSHHPVIDAVLNQKYQNAKDLGIDMHIQVNDLSGVMLPADMLVVLLSNLLDNAVEACQEVQDPAISCEILHQDSLFLSVCNTSLPVNIENGIIHSTKQPQREHGYGLTSIRHILEQLKAEYIFDYRDGCFQFSAELPNRSETVTQIPI